MHTDQNKKRNTALEKSGEGKGPDTSWIPTAAFAQIAGLKARTTQWAISLALAGKTWRGTNLKIRQIPGRGRGGMQHEVLISSLPVPLQMRWLEQNPPSAPMAIAADLEATEKVRPRAWTQEEREARHAGFTRRPTSIQREARRRLAAVQLFHSMSQVDASMASRYQVAAAQFEASPATLRQWVKVCRGLGRGDWLVALAPNHRGCQVTSSIHPDAYNYIKSEYFTLAKPSLKPIYRRAVRDAKARGWDALPSYATVKRRIEAEPRWYGVLMREGRDALAGMFPAQQRDYSTLKLHEIWCADGRMCDLFVRWPDGQVTRPVVVAWLELRSRVLLGYDIGRVESADVIRHAFKDAAEKSRALPEAVLMDNGRGFASKLLTGGVPNRYRFSVREDDVPGIFPLMGIEVMWALPENARAKPIESFWRNLAELDKRFPGAYVGNRPGARPEDCDPKNAVPVEEYRRLLEETLLDYHTRPHRGDSMDGRSPREAYEELIQQTVVKQPTREQLRLCMLAAERVKLDRREGSVRIHGSRYYTPKLALLPTDVSYVVRYNPDDLAEPVSVYNEDKFICEAPLVDRTGFRNQEAAKTYARAKRGFTKSREKQAAAAADMNKAAAWSGGEPDKALREAVAATLPSPKLAKPLRPEHDYRGGEKEEPVISAEEFLRIVTEAGRQRLAGGRK